MKLLTREPQSLGLTYTPVHQQAPHAAPSLQQRLPQVNFTAASFSCSAAAAACFRNGCTAALPSRALESAMLE